MSSIADRKMMIDTSEDLSVADQCDALDIARSSYYYEPVGESEQNLAILRVLDEWYLKTPYYGVKRLTQGLLALDYLVNEKRVRRLMRVQGWQTLYCEPRTTHIDPAAYKYPYLLRSLNVDRKNQVWAIDITYVPMKRGFMYLCAIIDLHTRYVVGWDISNSMTAEWCCQIVKDAIEKNGKPEILNSDQGSQFTSEVYTSLLKDSEIQISMDGKGRALDNIFIERLWRTVKYEHIYLHVYTDGHSLFKGLQEYFNFYNTERRHQSLDYKMPAEKYYEVA